MCVMLSDVRGYRVMLLGLLMVLVLLFYVYFIILWVCQGFWTGTGVLPLLRVPPYPGNGFHAFCWFLLLGWVSRERRREAFC